MRHRQRYIAECRELLGSAAASPVAEVAISDSSVADADDRSPCCPKCEARMRLIDFQPKRSWRIVLWGSHRPSWYRAAMAEPHLTTRRINSPCLFSSSSGPTSLLPEFRFRQLRRWRRAFFVVSTAESPIVDRSASAPHPEPSSRSNHRTAPEFRVTSHSPPG